MTPKFQRLHPDAVLPTRKHPGDSGADLHAVEDVVLLPGVPTLVKTGLAVQLPGASYQVEFKNLDRHGWDVANVTIEAQIRPRSGLSLNHGITVGNSPGTVDNGYRGEIGVIVMWNGHGPNVRQYKVCFPWPGGEDGHEYVWHVSMDGYLPSISGVVGAYGKGTDCFGYRIRKGDRIAQLVFAPALLLDGEWGVVDATERGEGGFGSTGK